MRIRESRPWSLNGGPQGPLLARIEPVNPTLEQLWEGRADIAFQGPAGRQLKCSASLLDAITEAGKVLQLPPLTLPVESTTWARHFHRHFQEQKGIADAYDTARACELRFIADELGSFALRCERESTPLRWVLRRTTSGYELRLLNDSGGCPEPRSFGDPLNARIKKDSCPAICIRGARGWRDVHRKVDRTHGDDSCTAHRRWVCTDWLQPGAELLRKTRAALAAAWSDAELWTAAKPSGNMFSLTRRLIVRLAILRQSMRLLCGDEWAKTEAEFVDGATSLGYLQRAVWKAGHEAEIAERLRKNSTSLRTADMLTRIREMAWVAKFLEGPDSQIHETAFDWLGEFVLRVVSDPAEVKQWAGGRLDEGMSYLIEHPTFCAGGVSWSSYDKELNSKGFSHELYASWRWR